MSQEFLIGGTRVKPGSRELISIPAVRLYTSTPVDIELSVFHGRKPGPVLLVTSTLHGDELNGVEICRQLMRRKRLSRLRGTLLVVPVVNSLSFIQQSRYLPDRRDLNRCFPGSANGSLGSRLAHILRTELLALATHAIDLHTGAIHRTNLPQIRADLRNPVNLRMAQAFNAPVILDSVPSEGTYRACASEDQVPTIVYEAGEALRFDPASVKAGVQGILRVMEMLDMLPLSRSDKRRTGMKPVQVHRSYWERAECDGMMVRRAKLGATVLEGEVICTLATPFDNVSHDIRARSDGLVIGANQIPLVNEGEALLHIAEFPELESAEASVTSFQDHYGDEELT